MPRKDFIKRKIELIEDDLVKLAEFKIYTLNDISSDFYKLNVVERLLEKIIMRAIDINEHIIATLGSGKEGRIDYKKTFLFLADLKICPESFAEKISKSAGLRNALIHDYDNIKIDNVYDSIDEALNQYHQYCSYVLKFIRKK